MRQFATFSATSSAGIRVTVQSVLHEPVERKKSILLFLRWAVFLKEDRPSGGGWRMVFQGKWKGREVMTKEKVKTREKGTRINLLLAGLITVGLVFSAGLGWSGEMKIQGQKVEMARPEVEHPIKNPKMYSKIKRCNQCGMMINMWARTRHSFSHPEGEFTSCSIRCVADKVKNSVQPASAVKVALYLEPEIMIPAEKATYVIGSRAKGTMTMKSKIAFADPQKAKRFVSLYGGTVSDFQGAFQAATMELPKSAGMIAKKRQKTGKIKEVKAATECLVCGMKVASYPQHDSQVLLGDNSSGHFCSTHCLIEYLANPGQFVKKVLPTKMIWTKVYPNGGYESAVGLYYVIGSKLLGPMGREAVPFRRKAAAQAFVKDQGGKIVSFKELVPQMVANE